MKCPVCSNANLMMTDRSGVEIDYCPECRGVWLDRGELDKIIERSTPSSRPPESRSDNRSDSHRGSDSHRYYSHGKRKKKSSLLGELFDF